MHSIFFSTKRSLLPLILSLLLLHSNCAEDSPVQVVQGTVPEVSNLVAPVAIYNGSTREHIISIKVKDPQGNENIEDVSYEITKEGATTKTTQGDLLDDGFHGDVIAKDGVFSNVLSASFAQGDTGSFTILAFALDKDGNLSETLSTRLNIKSGSQNSPPQIISVDIPTSVPIDSAFNFPIKVQVNDPDGANDILNVSYAFFPPASAIATLEDTLADNGTLGDQTPGDGFYTTTLSSGLFTKLTDHSLRIQVRDKAGNLATPSVAFVRGRPSFSKAPTITAAAAPRMINATETTEITVTADVTDSEGLADIDTVQLKALLPDNSEVDFSPVLLFDDGMAASSGDVTAGDGTFSALLPIQETGTQPIDIRFMFTATDKGGLASNPFERRFVIGFDNAPYISDLKAPSQVQINPTQDTRLLITLDVRDPQGLSGIALVQFRSFLPNGNEAGNSPIQLFDNGNSDDGDDISGDGIYSRAIFLPSQGVAKGDFRFVFEARDSAGNVSNSIEHIMTVQ